MTLFRNRNRPRVSMDLRVGNSHIVEVLLQMRRADWNWYQANQKEIEEDFLHMLESSILSRMFGEDIEAYHKKKTPQHFPQENTVGGKNSYKKGGFTKRKSKASKAAATNQKPEIEGTQKPEKDVYFAFGQLTQLAYRKEDLPVGRGRSGRTLFMKAGASGDLYNFPKLPHRLLIWLSRLDQKDPTNPDGENVGFFRPEMIPITSLFREPRATADETG